MNVKKRKILYISGTRADYGLMREALFCIKDKPALSLEIAATGMHLMPQYGNTIDLIKQDGFIVHEMDATFPGDRRPAMANFIGSFIKLLAVRLDDIKPDILLILGDRAEMLAAAVSGVYLGIPVAHIHGGDVSSTVDDISRHAITKLANIHFPATQKSAQRIIRMGEDPRKVFIVGAPGLDAILNEKNRSKNELAQKYGLDFSKPVLLVIQHPVTSSINDASRQMEETLEAVREMGFQAIVIYPNADAGGREMIKVIESYRQYPAFKIHKNIERGDYLGLMRYVQAMVGNSSSGIIESPLFRLPVVNVGERQEGRERSNNVIDVGHEKERIVAAIKKALFDKRFAKRLKKGVNPYGNGTAGKKIAKILSGISIDNRLLQKKITY